MTDGGDAGDTVLLGDLAHVVTCSTSCSAGNSPTSDAGAIALGAVSYTNTAASFVVAAGATFTYAGPVRQNNATWTIGAGATIYYDSSWSSAPTTALYSWSTRNTSTGSGGRLTTQGTSGSRVTWTIANSATNAACAANACRTGPVGASASNHQADSGTITCAYTDFSYLGSATTLFSNFGTWLSISAQSSSLDHCTYRYSNVVNFVEAGTNGAGGLTITGLEVTDSVVTAASTGAIGWTSLASSGTRTISNSYIEGPWATTSTGYTASNLTMTNVVFRSSSLGTGVHLSAAYAPRFTSDQVLIADQNDSDLIYQTSSGNHTRWVHARYTNSGQANQHPWAAPIGTDGLIRWHTIEGNMPGLAGDYISPGAAAQAGALLTIRDNIYICKGNGQSLGSFSNNQGGATTIQVAIYQNTYCSASATAPATDTLVQGVGWEASDVAAGTFQRIDSNLVYRSDAAGNVPVMCAQADGTGHTAAAGAVVSLGWNAIYNNSAASNYCAAAIANGHITSGPTGDVNYARAPSFTDSTRKLITFDVAYLGHPLGTAWATGQAYNVGDIVSDHQPTIYSDASFNWRMVSNAGGCATSGSTNRPYSGSAWVGCWEPASVQYIRTAVLAGTLYTDSTIGAADVGMIGVLNLWIRAGYAPTGADATNLRASGFGGIRVGAVDPLTVTVGPTSGVAVRGLTTRGFTIR